MDKKQVILFLNDFLLIYLVLYGAVCYQLLGFNGVMIGLIFTTSGLILGYLLREIKWKKSV